MDASPDALGELARRDLAALGSFEEAQRKAWALELMPCHVLDELKGDLELAGGWAGRAMSFAFVVSEDPGARRAAARRLLARSGLSRFVDYSGTFHDWSFEDGQREFRELVSAIVRFGLLPPRS